MQIVIKSWGPHLRPLNPSINNCVMRITHGTNQSYLSFKCLLLARHIIMIWSHIQQVYPTSVLPFSQYEYKIFS